MAEPVASTAAAAPAAGRTAVQRHLARNIASNWAWSLLELGSGFILPRLISDQLGPQLLGVWDVGWSLVFWVRWTHLGTTASVSRFTARFSTLRDWDSLNATANTSLAFLLAACGLGLLLAAAFAAAAPHLLHQASPEARAAAGWVILLLTGGAALQLPGGLFTALLTGHQRFDLLSLIRSIRDLLVLGAITALLLTGQGLVACAAVPFTAELLTLGLKYYACRRICPQLRFGRRYIRRHMAVEIGLFGSKTVLRDVVRGGVYHVSNLLVAAHLGPAAVAVYSRQRSLVQYLTRFIKQYGNVFIPASSALHAHGDLPALQRLLLQSARGAGYVALPPLWTLLIVGGPVLEVWMGPGYRAPAVLAVLVLGHALTIPQLSVYSVLMGMNRHGRVALFEIAGGAVSVLLGLLLLGPLQLGLFGAALALAGPIALSGGVLLEIYACRVLHLSTQQYVRSAYLRPLLLSLPFALCLLAARGLGLASPARTLLLGVGVGGLTTVVLYWRYALPASVRRAITSAVSRRIGAVVAPRPARRPAAAESCGRG